MLTNGLAALMILLAGASLSRGEPEFIAVENGRPRAVVVAGAADQAAAGELLHYVARVTGAQLQALASPVSGAPSILVGMAACPPEVQREVRRLDGDGYLIRTMPGGILVLAGNGADGTAFAVYEFLERFAGVRWLWPGDLGEVVPGKPDLRVPEVSIIRQPAYLWRDLGPGGALWGAMDKWAAERKLGVSEEHQRQQKLWEKRNRFGGPRIYGGHAFGEILPPAKYGPIHPEYYALVNGKRDWEHFDGKHGTQPCTTNPDVVRLAIEYARGFFDRHPDYEAFAISLNDGGGFCECDRCRRLDSGAEAAAAGDPEGGPGGRKPAITDRVVTFANEVAEAVSRSHPGKKLILFAYGPYREPPARVKVNPNLIIQYTFHAAENWDPRAEDRQYRETGAWSGAAKNLGIYEYFIQGNSPDLPRLMQEPIRRSVERLREQGYRYYQTQSGDGYATNGLNYYLLARLLWDPHADIRAIESDYLEKGFGRGAPAVGRYFRRWEEAWRGQKGVAVAMDSAKAAEYRRVAGAYPPALREACRRDLDEAAEAVEGRERERVEFLKQGLRYVDLTVSAVEKTIPLFDAGWKPGGKIEAPANAGRGAFEAALAAWEERDRYVEDLKQEFAIAYLWVRYNDRNRGFVPLDRMRAASAAARPDETRARIRNTLFVTDPLPGLAPETHGRFEPAPGVIAEKVTYGTQYGMRVPAILYLPKSRTGKLPGLIVVNGHGGDKYSWYAFYSGIQYARAGAAVLTYDPAGEGERNAEHKSGTRAHDTLDRDPMLGRRLGGLMMTDVMQAVSYLRGRPEVDPQRIGAMGYSMGSFVLSLACAVDTRIHACVLAGGGNLDGPGEYWDTSKPMCQAYPYQSLAFLGDRPAAIYALHAQRGPTLIINGLKDSILQPQRREPRAFFEDLKRRVDMPGRVFDTEYDPEGAHRPYFVTRAAAMWLERKLDFPDWSEDSIRDMPVSKMSDWAKANGVETDRLYATESSEGGTLAIGIGVPGLTRDQLSVFSRAEWEKRKDAMILETWVKQARAGSPASGERRQ